MRSLLGLSAEASEYVSTLGTGDVARLVYRDHVRLKHASRKRLASELESKVNHGESVLKAAAQNETTGSDAAARKTLQDRKTGFDLVSYMFGKYVLQASLCACSFHYDSISMDFFLGQF